MRHAGGNRFTQAAPWQDPRPGRVRSRNDIRRLMETATAKVESIAGNKIASRYFSFAVACEVSMADLHYAHEGERQCIFFGRS